MASLNIHDYAYHLPDEKIARFPLQDRDAAKLLVYKGRRIDHSTFRNLSAFLPEKSFLFFNDTKVIPARIHFKKETGADVEIFLLDPILPSVVLSETMAAKSTCSWHCTIGNLKRWTAGTILRKQIDDGILSAELTDRSNATVRFEWNTSASFAEIVTQSGETPLPPYLKRPAAESDKERYQTIYSHYEGAVAAPTAGLHFTEQVFKDLKSHNIGYDFVTLHVSAGTFQPVKVPDANEHVMHAEQIVINRKNIQNLLHADRFVIPVGTTSMRTLESLYWFGVKLLKDAASTFSINQNDPYENNSPDVPLTEALQAVDDHMTRTGSDQLIGKTSIFIKPGYRFRLCKGLITNFHQPGSTLILLVAAFIGEDWCKIYEAALTNEYRFLSFGDSSLLLPESE